MSILALYSHQWWDAPDDLEDDDDPPAWPVEVLTVTPAYGWWSAAIASDDDE